MKLRLLLIVFGLALLAAVGTLAVLSSGEDDGSQGTPPAARGNTQQAGLPTFRDDTPGVERAPDALQAAPGDAEHGGEDAPEAGAAPAGPKREIGGIVLRASDGTPIEGVTVSTLGVPTPLPATDVGFTGTELTATETGADGRFRLNVPAHQKNLRLASARAQQLVALPAGEQAVPDLEIVFDSGFRVAGVVLNEAGAPLPGAHVNVAKQVETQADESGRFEVKDITRPEDGSLVVVRARAPLYARGRAEVLAPRVPTERPWVEVRLEGSGRLEGRVTLPAGAPAVGTPVEVLFRMGTGLDNEIVSEASTSTNENGAYEIDHVTAGRYLVQAGGDLPLDMAMSFGLGLEGTVAAASPLDTMPRLPEAWVPDVLVATGQTTRLDIVLAAGASIAGRVMDTSGSPVADSPVRLTRVARWPAPDINGSAITSSEEIVITTKGGDGKGETVVHRQMGNVNTDAQGRYAFTRLPAGEYLLMAADSGGRLAPQDRTLVLNGDEALSAVDFLLSAGITLRSRVIDPAGRGLAGAAVYLRELGSNTLTSADQVAKSREDGTFEATGLSPKTMQISISLEGYGWLWEEVDTTAPKASYVLTPSPKLVCEAVDGATGEAVEAYAVQVEFEGSMMTTDTQPHEDGRFEYDVPGDVRCKVTITAPGYEPLAIEDIVPSSTAITPRVFRLARLP